MPVGIGHAKKPDLGQNCSGAVHAPPGHIDHGPAGIAQNHKKRDADKWNAVYHMSRSLVKSEINYNKVKGESLAVYSG